MPANGTSFEFVAATKMPAHSDVLVVPLASKPKPAMQALSSVDQHCDDAVSELLGVGALGDEVGKVAHTTRNATFKRIVVVSLGDAAKIDTRKIRQAAAAAAKWLIGERLKSATVWVDGLFSLDVDKPAAEWAGGMARAGFRFSEMKEPDKKAVGKVRVALASSDRGYVSTRMATIREELAIADAVNYACELAHRPGNVINPATITAAARALGRQYKLKCTVVDFAQAKRMGMGGLVAVGVGAEHKPCLVKLEHRGAPRARTNTVLVGKTITFDTGGYSIKTAAGMADMKFDKCGGTTVLGIVKAVASLKLKCNLVAILAVAENAISQNAYRPGDIIKMMSGKTVEVTNTDAEGRLVLADALWYAQKHCNPTALINLATLTGGVVTALGSACAGLMSTDDDLSGALGEAGRRTHERLWRLPLWDEYRDLIKGKDSDIKNAGSKRDAHPIQGGMFLKEFVQDKVPWAHLDIAGVAWEDGSKEASGFGVRLIVEYLRRRLG